MSKQDNLHEYVTDIAGTIRSVEGSTEKINAQDFSDRIRAIGGTSGSEGKTTPSFTSGRANEVVVRHQDSNVSSYPRWVEMTTGAELFTNNGVMPVDTTTWSFGKFTSLLSAAQLGITDIGNLVAARVDGTIKDLIVFYRANNFTAPVSYKIIGKILRDNTFVTDIEPKEISGAGRMYEPFIFGNYVYYCEETADKSKQDIKRAEITYTINNNQVTSFSLGTPEIIISGTDDKDDNGVIVASSRPGFPAIAQLVDGNLIMVYETNVNKGFDYPYTVRYAYSADNGATWIDRKTLFKTLNYNNNIPYVVVDPTGRVAISYHTNSEFFGITADDVSIHKCTFKAFISNTVVRKGDILAPTDFSEIPVKRNQINQWTGGWGSLAIIQGAVAPVYAWGDNTGNKGTIIDTVETSAATVERVNSSSGLVVYAHEDYAEKTIAAEVQAISDSIVRRNSSGFVYGSTTTNLEPTNEPTILTTKAYVAAYVTKFGNENYLPLIGGTISGNLSITGNLIVAGESTILEAQHLKVKDAIIETNSEGNNIPTISGLAIHKNTIDTYIIGYDPANDSVKLGFGEQDTNKNWVFKKNDGNPIATRADSSLMVDNGFVTWNQNNKRLETTIITGLSGEGEPDQVVYYEGIGFTFGKGCLLATTKISHNFNLVLNIPLISGSGITLAPTSNGKCIEAKLDTTFTDDKYVPIHNTGSSYTLYGTVRSGGQIVQVNLGFDQAPTDGTIVQRAEGGVVKVGTAVADNDAMPKKQVEDNFVKSYVGTPATTKIYVRNNAGVDTTVTLNTRPDNYSVAQRGIGGVLQVGTPTANSHATTKAYVDGLNAITITAGA